MNPAARMSYENKMVGCTVGCFNLRSCSSCSPLADFAFILKNEEEKNGASQEEG